LVKDLEGVSRSLNDAKACLQKASVGLDSGLVAFALCNALNSDIKKSQKTAGGFLNEASGYSKALMSGVMRINGWEETTKNRESSLAAQLGKTWGFEGGNFTGGQESSEPTPGSTGISDGNSGFVLRDESYYRITYAGTEGNCKAFVNAVIKKEMGTDVPAYTSKYYELQGKTPIENGQILHDPSKPLTENDVKNLFSNAKVGDVVQMRWTYGSQTQHTAIFGGFDDKGNVLFLESNVDPTGHNNENISIHSYSYSKLKDYYSHSGNGASIYRL
jgi:cell wall-associated NlpC family hydrolase